MERGGSTRHGLRMAELPVHPRLAHMLLEGEISKGMGTAIACDVAALLEERDVVWFEPGRQDADMRLRVDLVRTAREGRPLVCLKGAWTRGRLPCHVRLAGQFAAASRVLKKKGRNTDARAAAGLGLSGSDCDSSEPVSKGKFLLNSGRGAFLDETSSLASNPTWWRRSWTEKGATPGFIKRRTL
jgi:ATP-dependent helicase HrpB